MPWLDKLTDVASTVIAQAATAAITLPVKVVQVAVETGEKTIEKAEEAVAKVTEWR